MSSTRKKDVKPTIYDLIKKDTQKTYQDPLRVKPREFSGSLNDSLKNPSVVNKASVYDSVNQKHKPYKGNILDSLVNYPAVKRPEKPEKEKKEKTEPERPIPVAPPAKVEPTPTAPRPKIATPKQPEVTPRVEVVSSEPPNVWNGNTNGLSVGTVSRMLILFR